ncbi:hypothetical protein [Nocardia abscessus]|uniref:hypothetical protein n=1 Tax=Nocardia abscessus TaxID=120957 RepID=UPI002455127C|nr:hypothetical protein [Nocardia abscessus]
MPNHLPLPSGRIISVGQLYRDNREMNVRTLRVDHISERDDHGDTERYITCTVIRQEYDGVVMEPMRTTRMVARRLTSKSFVLVGSADTDS